MDFIGFILQLVPAFIHHPLATMAIAASWSHLAPTKPIVIDVKKSLDLGLVWADC